MVTDRGCVWAPNRYSRSRSRLPFARTGSVIPKELALELIRGGNRFSERIMLKKESLDPEPIQLNWFAG